ncbi:MAG TPA: NAD-binding protein [Ktedonobacterales bacterium]|nr:NAD-binding protein [Ktedonobacterales bacterium]
MADPSAGDDQTQSARRQRYSLWQRLRAGLYGRLSLFVESLVAVGLLFLVLLLDVTYLLQHGSQDISAALVGSISILALQGQSLVGNDQLGRLLLVSNVLFSVLFAQSLLNSARVLFRQRPVASKQLGLAATLSDHVVVCGLGRVGLRVITRLVEAGCPCVAIERDWTSELVPRVLDLHVPVLEGDAREPLMLRRAGLNRARAIIACIDGDLVDVEIALAARAEKPAIRVIVRAFSEEFDRGLEHSFGPNSAFSTSGLAAPTFAAATISRGLDHVVPLDDQLMGVAQLVAPAGSQLPATADALEARFGVRLLKVRAAGRSAKRTGAIAPGSRLVAIGPLQALEWLAAACALQPVAGHPALAQAVQTVQAPQGVQGSPLVIVCGLGKVGYRVVWLLRLQRPDLLIRVVYREDDKKSFTKRVAQLGGVALIRGDARDADTLNEAGLQHAVAVAAVTSDDLTNLQIGLEVRRNRPDAHVVLRVFSDSLADKLADLFAIHTAYSTSDLASPTLAAAAVLGNVEHAFFVGGQLYALQRLKVSTGDGLSGNSMAAIRARYQITVMQLRRSQVAYFFPSAHDVAVPGDELAVIAPIATLGKLRAN